MGFLMLKMSCVILILTCAIWLSEGQSCRRCPQQWTQVGGYCYRYFGGRKRWHDAHNHCTMLGAHLPSIHSRTEDVALYRLWKERSTDPTRHQDAYWIGLRDTFWEGWFRWTDGTSRDYTNWLSGEPNDSHGEDCVEIYNVGVNDDERLQWNDMGCEHSRSFFCRKPL